VTLPLPPDFEEWTPSKQDAVKRYKEFLERSASFYRSALLEDLATYEDGWNGEGSLAATDEVFANIWALSEFIPQGWTDATLNDNGTISFEGFGPREDYGCVEVGQTRVSIMRRRGNDRVFVNATIERSVDEGGER
jgi:hypothetical protein